MIGHASNADIAAAKYSATRAVGKISNNQTSFNHTSFCILWSSSFRRWYGLSGILSPTVRKIVMNIQNQSSGFAGEDSYSDLINRNPERLFASFYHIIEKRCGPVILYSINGDNLTHP